MIYLDYSATTPPDRRVLACFKKESECRFGNPNSSHAQGEIAKEKITEASNKIKKILGYENCEVIYTSGATEANNLAILGVCEKKAALGKHLVTTSLEHPSVVACFSYLAKNGFEVDVIDPDKNGKIDPKELEALIRLDTILVSVMRVNSEIGTVNDVTAIGKMLKKYPNVTFHSDMTQSIGKLPPMFEYPDLVTFSGHKIYGLKGIGALLKKNGVALNPLLHGGESVSPYRPGTPPEALIVSLAMALEQAYSHFSRKFEKVAELNFYLRVALTTIPGLVLNSPEEAIPQILNFSMPSLSAPVLQKRLSDQGIYVSTQSACCFDLTYSRLIDYLYEDRNRAESSIRVSLSHLTKMAELKKFVDVLASEALTCK